MYLLTILIYRKVFSLYLEKKYKEPVRSKQAKKLLRVYYRIMYFIANLSKLKKTLRYMYNQLKCKFTLLKSNRER